MINKNISFIIHLLFLFYLCVMSPFTTTSPFIKKRRIFEKNDMHKIFDIRDVWITILSFIEHKQLHTIMQINSSFQKITTSKGLWKKIQIVYSNRLVTEQLVNRFRPSTLCIRNPSMTLSIKFFELLSDIQCVRELILYNVTLRTNVKEDKFTLDNSLSVLKCFGYTKSCYLSSAFIRKKLCNLKTFHYESKKSTSFIFSNELGCMLQTISTCCRKLNSLSVYIPSTLLSSTVDIITYKHFSDLKFLNIDVESQLTNNSLMQISKTSKQLQCLHISYNDQIHSDGISHLQALDSLLELKLFKCNNIVGGFTLNNRVRRLYILKCFQFQLPVSTFFLDTLCIDGAHHLLQHAATTMLSDNQSTLKYLTLTHCSSLESFEIAVHMPFLISLDLSFNHNMTPTVLRKIITYTRLKSLSLEGCPKLTDNTIRQISNMKHLKHLCIGKILNVQLDTLQSLATIPLETFRFSEGESSIDGDRLFVMKQFSHTLKTLQLTKNRHVNSKTVTTIAKYFDDNLVHLNLSNTMVSDDIFSTMYFSLPNIRSLDLSGCDFLTRDAFLMFPSTLRVLIIARCYTITDYSIIELSKKKQLQLEYLSLESCRNISYFGISHLVQAYPYIRLNLQYTNLSKKELSKIVQNIENQI